MEHPLERLKIIYEDFDQASAAYRRDAACARGCAFCCTHAGRIDCTTLEGLAIREETMRMPRPRRTSLAKALQRDVKKREAGATTPCPFLTKNKVCTIYSVRPFACRRIYSLHVCSQANPPILSRHVMALADSAIASLQRLDENGYTGHLSFILHMLDNPQFLKTYLAGDFKPGEIMAFGKTHRIVINKMVV
jgi:Fe-S-cluster containining protein